MRSAYSRPRKSIGAAMSEYLPIVAIVLSVAMQVVWREYGDVVRGHGATISTELAGTPSYSAPPTRGNPGSPFAGGSGGSNSGGSNYGGSGAGGSNSGGSGSGAPSSGGSGSGSGSGSGDTGAGAPDFGNLNPGNSGPGNSYAGGVGGGAAGNESGGGNQEGSGDGSTSQEEEDASILRQASEFAGGLWSGFRTQFWGIIELVTNPVDTARSFYILAESLVRDFDGTIDTIVEAIGRDIDAVRSGDPRAIGQIIGENVSPTSLLRIAQRLSHIADSTRRLDTACSSFTEGTLIWTEDGFVAIENIAVGSEVLARNDQSFDDSYQQVEQLFSRQVDYYYALSTGFDEIHATAEHPFWVQGQGWTKAADLRAGHAIASANGDILIRTTKRVDEPVMVYNFEVANDHSYFVSHNGLWVHNPNEVCDLANRNRDTDRPSRSQALAELNTHTPGRQRSADDLNYLHEIIGNHPPYMPGTTVTDRVLQPNDRFYAIEYQQQPNPGLFATNRVYTNLEEARRDLALLEGWKPNDGTGGGLVMREYTVINALNVRDSVVGPQTPTTRYSGGGQQFDIPLERTEWAAADPVTGEPRWQGHLSRRTVHEYPSQ